MVNLENILTFRSLTGVPCVVEDIGGERQTARSTTC